MHCLLSRKRGRLLKAFSIIGLEMAGVCRLMLDASGADVAAANIIVSNIKKGFIGASVFQTGKYCRKCWRQTTFILAGKL
jgi:hypothetical protein